MATITQPSDHPQTYRENALSNLFARAYVLNWEVIAWTAILLVALFTRFFILGARVMSHDESLHTVFSNNLYQSGNYTHDPMMHGPILFHMTALSYFLFGVNDFSARVYPALLGVIIVMFPLLFRRWLGRTGAMLAGVMLLFSPLLTYYSRYIRHDIPSILAGLIMFWAAMMYLSGPENQRRRAHWLYILAAAMLWNLGSKETSFIYIAIFGLFLTIYWLVRVVQHYFRVDGYMVFTTMMIGFLLAGVAALAMIVVLTISLVEYGTLSIRLDFLGDEFAQLIRFNTITPAFSSFLSWTGLVIVTMLTIIISPAVWAYRRKDKPLSWVQMLSLGAGIAWFIVLGAIWSPEYVGLVENVEIRSSLAAVGLAVGLTLALSFWLIVDTFLRMRRGTPQFNMRLLTVIAIAVVAMMAILLFEELSFEPSRSAEVIEQQPVPGENGEVVMLDGAAAGQTMPRTVTGLAIVLTAIGLLYVVGRALQYYFGVEARTLPKRLSQAAIGALAAGLVSLPVLGLLIFIGMRDLTADQQSAFTDRSQNWLSDSLSWLGDNLTTRMGVTTLLLMIGFALLVVLAVLALRWRATWKDQPGTGAIDGLVVFIGWMLFLIVAVFLVDGEIVLTGPDFFGASAVQMSVSLALFITGLIGATWLVFPITKYVQQNKSEGALFIAIGLTLFSLLAFGVVEGLSATRNDTGAQIVLSRIALFWAFAILLLAVLLDLKYRGAWRLLDPFPEFDVLIIMGAMVLPWLTAVISRGAGHDPADMATIGNSIGVFTDLVPRDDPAQVGRIVVGFLAWVPMMSIAVIAGLLWNWRRFIIAFLVFHALFAFFFTTVFTNIEGLASGMVYGLDYWMEQQGVRRGGQPQYYYTLIIMPFYEFLPIIGSVLAMIAGMVIFWKRGRAYDEDAAERKHLLARSQAALAINSVAMTDEVMPSTVNDESVGDEVAASDEMVYLASESVDEETAARVAQITDRWRLMQAPFLVFVAWWAVLTLIAYTLAGEKMPWLGTHLTVPLILLSGWYFGRVIEKIHPAKLFDRGWIYLFLLPFLFMALFQVVAPFLSGNLPFQGTASTQLQDTYGWLGVLAISAGLFYAIYRLLPFTGWPHLRRMIALVAFVMLALMTFRSSWLANFENYDEASEFLVYAHAAPGNKLVMDQVREWSLQTTDSYNIRILHDDRFSWPGSWYLRDFTNTKYLGSSAPSAQDVDGADIIIVGDSNRGKVEPLLEDRFVRYDHLRMWWPMQEYFDLSPQRVNGVMELDETRASETRRGLFDIWWARDYSRYAAATANPNVADSADRYNIDQGRWQVSDTMHLYVRKDLVAQVWQYGVGEGDPNTVFTTVTENVCRTNWQPTTEELVLNAPGLMRQPLGLALAPDGRLYVAESEESTSRLSIFNQAGGYDNSVGAFGGRNEVGLSFNRPHGVAFGPDGNLYVVDTWNFMVRVFDPDTLEPITSWGSVATDGEAAQREPTDGFWGPRDIVVDNSGLVYVADTGNKRIRVYMPNGTLVRDLGGAGSAQGNLNEPAGLAIANDRLYVADTWNRRISVFNLDGTFAINFPVQGWYEDQGNRPYLATDEARGLLYVTDPDAGRVLIYDLEGNCLSSFGQSVQANPGPGEFVVVGGIAVADDGAVYVTDLGAGRVLKYPPYTPQDVAVDAMPADGAEGGEINLELDMENPAELTPEADAAG